ncbi:MAG: polymer-forming cytoskeletal protein [Elusimicrobia bacterium]|nr:polymer-forming cytoskeletal protein [Elusimicrobiota bacterium]
MSKKKTNGLSVVETFIGANSIIKGSIQTKNSVRIDGNIEGNIVEADGVIVGEKASIKGDINARIVVIGGKVTGNISAIHNIEILSKAEVRGDMRSSVLSIAEGAIIEGSCVALSDDNKVIELDVESVK